MLKGNRPRGVQGGWNFSCLNFKNVMTTCWILMNGPRRSPNRTTKNGWDLMPGYFLPTPAGTVQVPVQRSDVMQASCANGGWLDKWQEKRTPTLKAQVILMGKVVLYLSG